MQNCSRKLIDISLFKDIALCNPHFNKDNPLSFKLAELKGCMIDGNVFTTVAKNGECLDYFAPHIIYSMKAS